MATATQIGLTATLDISHFQRNAATYMATLRQMQTAAGQSTTSMNNSFSQAGNMGGGLIPTLDSIGKGFLAIGAAATAAAVGGVAMFASSSIQMASDFEQSLADIAARMRETVDSITPLRDEIYDIALNPNLKVSMVEASEASLQLASAGITMEQQLGGALQSTIEFQNAVGGKFGLAANVAITAMDTFGLGADSLGAAVDGATGAINRSKLDLQKYAYVITNAGTSFAGFGGTLSELNTVAAATASMFVSGQRQGTGMAEMMNRMAVPTEKAKKRMAELGITFWDNTGKAKNLFDIVDELRVVMANLSPQEQRTAMVNIFGKQGAPAMIALLRKTGDELRALEAEVNASGQAADAAATRMNTLQGAFGAFNDLIGATATSIGSMFTPLLKNSFQSINATLTPLVKAFDLFGLSGVANMLKLSKESVQTATDIDESFKKLYATLTTGNFTAALEQMGFNVDYLTTGLYALTGAVAGLMILGTVAATVFATGAAIAALSSPIGQAIAGAALLGAAWGSNFLGIRDAVFMATGAFTSFIYENRGLITMALGTTATVVGLGMAAAGIVAGVSFLSATFTALGGVLGIATIALGALATVFGVVATGPVAVLGLAVVSLVALVYTNFEELKSIVSTGVEAWNGIFDRGTSAIYLGVTAIFNALPGPIKTAMSYVYDIVVGTMNSAIEYVNSALSSISSAAGGYVPEISLPSISGLVFPDMAGSGAGLSESISSMFALPESVGQTFDVGSQSVYRFQAATTAATQAAITSKLAYADESSGLIDLAGSSDKAGKAATKMADDIEKAKEKISDTNLSMANLRGEIQELEAKFPGLTQEIIANFNAHTAAGNSVASFGDKLGATERRQMFNYLTKLIDMNDANRQLAASNGLVGGSLGMVSDGFMDMVSSMSAGLGDSMTELPVVASMLPAATQSMNDSSTATTSMATSAAALNPQLETMAAIHTDSLNPALLLTSTYLPTISESWLAITEAITLLTTTPLPSLATVLTTTINPALLTMQTQVDALGNTSLANLSNMILSQVMPALGQMFTSLSTQVTPAMLNATTQSNLLTAAAIRLVDAGNQVVDVSNKIRSAMLKEIEVVKKLAEFYLALAAARREANQAANTGLQPGDSGAGFARGGSFIVPSGYPSSGYGMPMRVHSGELVKVFTAAQTRQMTRSQGNSRIVSSSNSTTNNSNRVVNFNITTQQPSKSILNDLAFAKAKYGVF